MAVYSFAFLAKPFCWRYVLAAKPPVGSAVHGAPRIKLHEPSWRLLHHQCLFRDLPVVNIIYSDGLDIDFNASFKLMKAHFKGSRGRLSFPCLCDESMLDVTPLLANIERMWHSFTGESTLVVLQMLYDVSSGLSIMGNVKTPLGLEDCKEFRFSIFIIVVNFKNTISINMLRWNLMSSVCWIEAVFRMKASRAIRTHHHYDQLWINPGCVSSFG